MLSILKRPKNAYLFIISIFGFIFPILALVRLGSFDNIHLLLFLIVLAASAEIVPTFNSIGKSTIAYEVGTAVSMAAIPFFGPLGASLCVVVSGLAFWLVKSYKTPLNERRWDQLAFNMGMHSLAVFIAGHFFLYSQNTFLTNQTPFFIMMAWLMTAIVYDQINLWLLIFLLRMMHGQKFKALDFWQQNCWAMVINISVLTIGGYLLSLGIEQLGALGILIFFLPIGLSSFSFQIYVRQMQSHMDNLEAIIEDRTSDLAALMKEKDAFLAVLTHDMKTPLTSIGLYTTLLKRSPDLIHKKPQILDVIENSQQTLIKIVNDILDIEKLESQGSLSIKKEPVNFTLLLNQAVETLQPQANIKNVDLIITLPNTPLWAEVDYNQMERVLHNLISNSIKYSPELSSVFIKIHTVGKSLCIEVEDTGYGIAPEALPHIFSRFRRLDDHTDLAAGTGLGLAITKALIEAHDGKIEVESCVGKGTIFMIEIPSALNSGFSKN